MRFFTCTIAILSLLSLPGFVTAETVVRAADTISIADDQVIEEDFYAAAGSVTMSGTVAGDMYTAGGNVTINGPVTEDLTAIAGSFDLHASVTDDVRIIGGEVVLADAVGGDVFVFGGVLKVLSTASVGGDVFFFGGEADISGPVAGSVMGTYERLRINTTVAGDIDVTTARALTLGDRANVTGNIVYVSNNEIVRSQRAIVDGEITRNTTAPERSYSLQTILTPILIAMFSTIFLYLVGRKVLNPVAVRAKQSIGLAGLWGLAVLFFTPAVCLVFIVTVLGIPVGIFLALVYIGLLLVSYVLAPIILGLWVFPSVPGISLLHHVVVGLLLFHAIVLVPVVGPVFAIVMVCISVGMLTRILTAWMFS